MTTHAELHAWQLNARPHWSLPLSREDAAALVAEWEARAEVVRAFLAKYDALEPILTGMFATNLARYGRQYDGENWATELAALRSILSADPS